MSSYKVQDNSTNGVGTILQMLKHFVPYAQQELGFQKPVMISFQSDEENANKLLGKTGYYNPQDYSIAIYVDSRHPKDVLRSLSHELVHHSQNCNGDFDSGEDLGPGYAQDNPVMRDAELDAYKRGNIIFRDFEDLIKKGKIKVNINFEETGEPKMSLKEWRNGELNQLLMEKWGLAEKRFANDPKLDKDGESEDLEEGIMDTIGNVASRAGAFGKKSKNMEYWRRKGEQEAEDYLEKIYGHREIGSAAKKRIMRQARKDFWAGDDASRNAVTDAVKAAVKGGDKEKADKATATADHQAKEKARLADKQKRQDVWDDQERRLRKQQSDEFAKQRKSRGAPGGTWSDVHNTAFSHKLEEEDAAYRDDDDTAPGDDDVDNQKSEGLANVASAYRKEDEGSEEHNDEEGNRPSFARKMGLKKETLTLDEARDLARRIFEKLTQEAK